MTANEIISSARIGLPKTNRKAYFLGSFYNELVGYDKKSFSIMAGLVKRFESEIIFEAIIDYYKSNRQYPLVYYCKVREDQKQNPEIEAVPNINLNDYMKGKLVNG